MKGAALFGILVVSILIMGGSFYYFHEQDQKILPKYSISLDFKDNSSFNASYPITLSGVPSGNETYQQLITLNNYSKYGINDNGSNIEFFDAFNLTHLYAWIQSINATSIQLWVKNYNDSSKIDMQVFPELDNFFSATGYLGNVSYFNANKVFLSAWVFTKGVPNGFSVNNVSRVKFNNSGITFLFSNTFLNSNNSYSYSSNILDFYANPHTNITDFNGSNVYGGYPSADASWYLSGSGTYSIVPFQDNSSKSFFGKSYYDFTGYSLYGIQYLEENTTNFYLNNTFYQKGSINLTSPSEFSFSIPGINSVFAPLTVQYAFIRQGNYIMPTFTIGSAYHPLSSFSISSNSLVVNTTFMEHNLTGYQYYAFSPVYNGNPVWFLVNGQIGDRLSVLLDGNVSLTVQILGYSYSNIIKEVKVE